LATGPAGLIRNFKLYWTGDGWRKEIRRHLAPAFLISLIVSGVFAGLLYKNAFSQLESRTVDWRFSFREVRPASAQDSVVIVAIDDQTLSDLKLRWPAPRGLHARTISRLSEAGARVVALDFVFSEDSAAVLREQDRLLGEAIVHSRSWVVMGGKFVNQSSGDLKMSSFVAPTPHIDLSRTHVGFVDMPKDADGVIRNTDLIQIHQNKRYFSFAVKILDRYFGFDPNRTSIQGDWLRYDKLLIPAKQGVRMLINFRGGPGNFRTISLSNILDDTVFPGLKAAGVFKDKIVLVGPTFAEAQDVHTTPYSGEYGATSGVEIHANILDTILTRNFLWRMPDASAVGMIFLLVMLCSFISIRLRPLFSPLVMLTLIASQWTLALLASLNGSVIVPMFLPTLALGGATISAMAYRALTEERRGRQIKSIFSRYVSPKVVEELVKNPHAALTLGGKKQVVTILFSDIRNFTTLSEQLKPEQVVELLNEYFQSMTDVIFAHDGTVDKFIGDAIMAVFGAPVAHEDDPFRAVKTGLLMLKALDTLNTRWAAQGKRTLAIGIGINTGEAIVGNMGSTQAMGYTVIGDTVNLASRLEGLNKELHTSLLISESTYRYVRNRVEAQAFSGVKVKGKAEAITVYAVQGLKGEASTAESEVARG